MDLARYREVLAFAQFATDLDKATRDQLTRGAHLQEMLKQPQFAPLSADQQVLVIYAGNAGYLDDVPLEKMRDFERSFLRFAESKYQDIAADIKKTKKLSDETEQLLKQAITEFKTEFMK